MLRRNAMARRNAMLNKRLLQPSLENFAQEVSDVAEETRVFLAKQLHKIIDAQTNLKNTTKGVGLEKHQQQLLVEKTSDLIDLYISLNKSVYDQTGDIVNDLIDEIEATIM